MVDFAPRMLWTGWLSFVLFILNLGPSSTCSLYRGQQHWIRPYQHPGALGSRSRQEGRNEPAGIICPFFSFHWRFVQPGKWFSLYPLPLSLLPLQRCQASQQQLRVSPRTSLLCGGLGLGPGGTISRSLTPFLSLSQQPYYDPICS